MSHTLTIDFFTYWNMSFLWLTAQEENILNDCLKPLYPFFKSIIHKVTYLVIYSSKALKLWLLINKAIYKNNLLFWFLSFLQAKTENLGFNGEFCHRQQNLALETKPELKKETLAWIMKLRFLLTQVQILFSMLNLIFDAKI